MPTYESRCNKCSHQFELFQSMKDSPKRKCPECGKNALERLIGVGAGIIFKGSGFYETDYRSDSYKKSAAADKAGASEKKNGSTSAAKDSAAGAAPATPCAKGAGCGCAPKPKD